MDTIIIITQLDTIFINTIIRAHPYDNRGYNSNNNNNNHVHIYSHNNYGCNDNII